MKRLGDGSAPPYPIDIPTQDFCCFIVANATQSHYWCRILELLHRQEGRFGFSLSRLKSPGGRNFSWSDAIEPLSLQVVFNYSGEGLVFANDTRLTLLPRTLSLFHVGEDAEGLSATRFGTSKDHDFLLLSLPRDAVEQSFGSLQGSLRKNLGILRRWTNREEQFFNDIVSPPVPAEAHQSWFLAKTLEILSLHLFQKPDQATPLFCTTIKENAHRHVREALCLLQARLDEPLDLNELAGDIGCAPHYLSRLVKQGTGKPLSLHLRQFRIERAAELLAGNQLNVTEVALEVGYQSLSHFSKAFVQEKEMTPSQFLKRSQSTYSEQLQAS